MCIATTMIITYMWPRHRQSESYLPPTSPDTLSSSCSCTWLIMFSIWLIMFTINATWDQISDIWYLIDNVYHQRLMRPDIWPGFENLAADASSLSAAFHVALQLGQADFPLSRISYEKNPTNLLPFLPLYILDSSQRRWEALSRGRSPT